MDVLEILRTLFGIILIFFLTGFLIINKFFKELSNLEKIALTIGVSIIITILIGTFLAFIGKFSLINSLALYLIIIILILMIKK
jgi:uncharacterized membrane protein